MKRVLVEPGDSITMFARDMEHATEGPVFAGVTGTATIYNEAGSVVDAVTVAGNINSDWYAIFVAPVATGIYPVVMVLTLGTAQRTLRAELRVV